MGGDTYNNTNSPVGSQGNSGDNYKSIQNIGEGVSLKDVAVQNLVDEIKRDVSSSENIADKEIVTSTISGMEKDIENNNQDGFSKKIEMLKLVAPTISAVATLAKLFL